MKKGIDVSENNGIVDWDAVKEVGIEFAIIRLGYGRGHLDEMFFKNFTCAVNKGIDVGVYYYSYALDEQAARDEARFLIGWLKRSGITPERLPYGIWFDIERKIYSSGELIEDCQRVISGVRQRGTKD